MATLEELQTQVATLTESLAAVQGELKTLTDTTPTSYSMSRYSTEETDRAVDRAKEGGAIDAALSNKVPMSGNVIRTGLTGGTFGGGSASIVGNGDGAYLEAFSTLDDYPNRRSQLVLFAPDVGGPRADIAQTLDGQTWTEAHLATATPPQEYDLPLAEGVSGAIKYRKNQFGEVSVSIRIQPNTPITPPYTIATMPIGFRPVYGMSAVAYAVSGGVGYIGTIDFNADGTITYFLPPISGASDIAIANAQFVST